MKTKTTVKQSKIINSWIIEAAKSYNLKYDDIKDDQIISF